MCWVKAEPFHLAVSKGGPVPCALVSLPSAPITYTLSCTETIFKLDYFEAGQIHLPSMVLCPQKLPLCYWTTTWGFWVFYYISLKDGSGESILHVQFAMQLHLLLHVLCLSLLIWVAKDEKIAKWQRNVTWMYEWGDLKGSARSERIIRHDGRLFFCCIIKVMLQNSASELSVTYCSSSVCNSICEVPSATEEYGLVLQRGKWLSCLIGFYKCESFGLRNPTSRPHTAAILPATISRWLRPAIDHGCDSFSFSLSIKLVLMMDSRWAAALAIRRERQGRFLPSVHTSTPTGSTLFCDLDPASTHHLWWGLCTGIYVSASKCLSGRTQVHCCICQHKSDISDTKVHPKWLQKPIWGQLNPALNPDWLRCEFTLLVHV